MNERYAVYMLASKKNGTLYVGVTGNLPLLIGKSTIDRNLLQAGRQLAVRIPKDASRHVRIGIFGHLVG